ncbi:MAG: nucleotidyltransferase family protein [Syntrophus sp. SKADARSKE-3]|nr:nucleotidyltransferase family protein [Syntrophus sp. SKADARSKE-3]
MRAILLAGGFGTRLQPITNTIPKCLLPINGIPLLEIWLNNLTCAGVGPFLINTHYLAEQVEQHFLTSPHRRNVKLVYEPELLGTAGTLFANIDFFQDEDGFLIHADNYALCDWRLFIKAHLERPAGCLMTMLTFNTDNPSSCGIVELNEQGVLMRFHEKIANPPGNRANGAVYILSKDFIRDIRSYAGKINDISTQLIGKYLGKIYTYHTNEAHIDIGTPETYLKVMNLGLQQPDVVSNNSRNT